MLLMGKPYFDTNRNKIIAFAAQQNHFREYVVDGGLMNYGILSLADQLID